MHKFNIKKYIKEAARKLPIYEALVNDSLYSTGQGHILVARLKPNGDILFCVFLLDIYCLGVKDVFWGLFGLDEYNDLKNRITENGKSILRKKSSNYIFNLIYGAVEYAEDLGLKPHKDYELAEYILDEISTIEYEDIEFGYKGKPLYIAGQYENPAKILGILNKSIGEGNYDFITPKAFFDEEDNDNGEFGPLSNELYIRMFPEGQRETRSMILQKGNQFNLPAGEYGFMERFCTDKTCDCRHVDIFVINEEIKEPLAVINYGWETRDFYKKWDASLGESYIDNFIGPALKEEAQQSQFAESALMAFKFLLQDPVYEARIQTHYNNVNQKIGRISV